MKVYTLTSSAGPLGTLSSDRVVEVPDATGKHLIEIGAARAAAVDEKVTATWPHGPTVPKAEKVEVK